MAYFIDSYLRLPLIGARVGYLQPHSHMTYRCGFQICSDTLLEHAYATKPLVADPFLYLLVSSLCLLPRSRLCA